MTFVRLSAATLAFVVTASTFAHADGDQKATSGTSQTATYQPATTTKVPAGIASLTDAEKYLLSRN